MNIKHRLSAFAAGLALAAYGWSMMARHRWAYQNSLSMTVFSPAVIMTGLFIALLAFGPPGRVVERWMRDKKSRRPGKQHRA